MNPGRARGLLACLLLAFTAATQAQVERYVEGVHYKRIDAAAGAPAEARNSVVEIFWYGCGGCYAFDPVLNAWVQDRGARIAFTRSPMIWDANTQHHAQLFFVTQDLGLHAQLHARIFDEIHLKRNYLLDEASVAQLLAASGIEPDAFEKSWNSFAVDAQLRKAQAWQRGLVVPGVPALVVGGRYLVTSGAQVPTHQAMLDVVDFLLDKR